MADVFISYAREDRDCAELLNRALTARGWSVWWDRNINVGHSFSAVIERELDRARCVIVLWSRHSLQSEWVQNEAAEAAHRKALVPVRIDDVRPPLEFRRLQTADFLDWRQGFDSPAFDACIQSIELLAEAATQFISIPPASQNALRGSPGPASAVTPPPVAQPAPQMVAAPLPQPPYTNTIALPIPNYLTPAVLVTFCCCLPIGIVAIIYAARVNGKLAAGDVVGARSASETARTLCWIGFIGGVVIAGFYMLSVLGFGSR
jgi:TIR domain/Interferon-induced transmembrane protein